MKTQIPIERSFIREAKNSFNAIHHPPVTQELLNPPFEFNFSIRTAIDTQIIVIITRTFK